MFKKLFALLALMALSIPSYAALSATEITEIKSTISGGLTDVAAISVSIFGVLAGIWGIRKVVKLLNRS